MGQRLPFKPINETHSIKEAVISVFLVNPITKPERFSKLIEQEFATIFQQAEIINGFSVEVKANALTPPNVNSKILEPAGVRFLNFQKGKIDKALQIMNEDKRTFISYHSLNYSKWDAFFKDFLSVIKVLAEQTDSFISSVSLHYIDEFLWIGDEPIDLGLLFDGSAVYIPKEFWQGKIKDYVIVTEKEIDNKNYLDRLEIKVERFIRPSVLISHNVFLTLSDFSALRDLILSKNFEEIFDSAHKHNKEILNDLLQETITDSISLNQLS